MKSAGGAGSATAGAPGVSAGLMTGVVGVGFCAVAVAARITIATAMTIERVRILIRTLRLLMEEEGAVAPTHSAP